MKRFVSNNKRLLGKSKAILLGLVLLFTLSASFLPATIRTASALTPTDSGNTSSTISDSYIANAASQYCNTSLASTLGNDTTSSDSQAIISACETGYTDGFKQDPKKDTACGSVSGGLNNIKADIAKRSCQEAYDAGKADGPQFRDTASDSVISAAADQYCSGKPTTPCRAGFIAGYKNSPSKTTACSKFSTDKSVCQKAYDAGSAAGSAVDASRLENPSGNALNTTDNTSANRQLGCDTEITNPLTWLLCPVIDLLNGVVDTLDGWITEMLNVNSDQIFGTSKTSQAYFQAWSSFRNIALGLMVIAGLVVLIAQAVGMEILDAYTIRKVLPRILIAALGITLSWPLMQFFINLTNDLGLGIRHLIYAPFSNLGGGIDLSFSHSFLGGVPGGIGNFFFGAAGLATAAVGTIVFIGIILSLAGTAALAVLIAFVVLILRQVAVIMLVLIAPIAIVTYILPNTQRVYQFWWDSFSKALLMFPLIAAFIATGRVFSAITLASNTSILGKIIGFLAYFAPYFLIPLTFKFAGGFVRQLGGFVNDRGKGVFDRLRQGRSKQMQQIGQDVRSGNAARWLGAGKPDSALNMTRRGLQRSALIGKAGVRPSMWKDRINQAITNADTRGTSKELLNDAALASINGNDTLAQALVDNDFDLDRTRAALTKELGGTDAARTRADQMVAAYAVANSELRRKGYSDRAIQIATMLSGASASTAFTRDEDFVTNEDGVTEYIGSGNLAAAIQKLSNGDSNLQAQMVAGAMEATPNRPELMPSFSEGFAAVGDIETASSNGPDARRLQIQQSSKTLRRIAVYKKGLRALFAGGHSSKHLGKEYESMLKEAHSNYVKSQAGQEVRGEVYDVQSGKILKDQPLTKAEVEDKWLQMAAEVVAAQNNASNLPLEVRPAVAELIDLQLGEVQATGEKITMQGATGKLRTDEKFQKYVSDFSYLQREAAKQAAREGENSTSEEIDTAAVKNAVEQANKQGPGNPPINPIVPGPTG